MTISPTRFLKCLYGIQAAGLSAIPANIDIRQHKASYTALLQYY